jgi:hemoglobin
MIRLIKGTLLNIARDKRIVAHFSHIDVMRLRDKLVEKVGVETGGPCRYTATAWLSITTADT